jgi:hypothetical protein
MSIFASHTTDTFPIPFDAPHTVTIQKLAGRDVDDAQLAHMTGVVSGRGRNWATRFLELARRGQATDADARKVLDDPLSGYDRITLVARGVKAWTYTNADGTPTPITLQAVEDLVDEALEFFARAVLKLTKPALFQSADEREGDRKNG